MLKKIITYPSFFEGEIDQIKNLLEDESVILHLRKPEASDIEYENLLRLIPAEFLSRVVLHDAYELRYKYAVGGLHFSTQKRELANDISIQGTKSTSCHSIEELKEIDGQFDYVFLSPIFPSISKQGYKGNLDMETVTNYLQRERKTKIVALGGINDSKIDQIKDWGFDGYAKLGDVWTLPLLLEGNRRGFVLSIAGFDPCGGAGLLADIKVYEHLKTSGLGVVSALTYQNDAEFNGVKWCSFDEIEKQFLPLQKYPIKAVKIGLIESFEQLEKTINLVKTYFPDAYIIWDPILEASAGFIFHQETSFSENLSKKINLITPNYEEFLQLQLDESRPSCAVLLKGGHREDKKGIDVLMTADGEHEIYGAEIKNKHDKHGTGCVLSAAIAAYIAQGKSELEACQKAKLIVEKLIQSNKTKLGYLN